jgi:predicted small lipoprotein YifL
MKRIVRFSALSVLAVFALAACGPSGTVRLLYRPADATLIPPPTAAGISVVQFKDSRPNSYIGVRRDNSPFVPNGTVAEWVSRSLADELNRQGLRVTYAQNLETARASQPQYILTGELQELWIRESSGTDISASVKAFISVSGHRGRIVNEGMSSFQSRQGLLGSSAAEELLYNTMQELAQAAAAKTQQAISARR